MRRTFSTLIVTAIAMSPIAAIAAPHDRPVPAAIAGPIVPVQGWWEQEHREDSFRDRYWHLPPEQRARYDRLEFQIRRSQERLRHEAREGDRREYYGVVAQIEQMRREQYRILRSLGVRLAGPASA
jgi:hypothetical protein